MSANTEFKELIDLACEKSTSTAPFYARAFFETCASLSDGRESYRQSLESEAKGFHTQSNWFGIATIVCFVAVVGKLAADVFNPEPTSSVGVYLALILAAFALCGVSLSKDSKSAEKLEELELFEPLNKNPVNCSELMELTLACEQVKRYVQSVVAANEPLTLGDFKVAHAILKGAKKQEANVKGQEACRELHQLIQD